MKQFIQVGSTSKRMVLFVQNATSTTGAGLTGLTNASSGLVWNWYSETSGTSSAVSIVGQTVGTWTSGGFVEINSTNLPGFYEIGIPNVLLTGVTPTWTTMQFMGAANMVPVNVEIELTGFNPASGTFTSTVVGGTISTVTGTVTATVPTEVSANVTQWLGTAVTSNAGVPIVDVAAGTVTTVTGNVGGSVASVVGTVTATVPTQVNANVQDWLGTAVTSNAGVPLVDVAGGTINTVTGTVTATVPSAVTVTGTVTATVPTLSTNVNVVQWLGTAVTSNAGVPLVDVNAVTGTVTATVVGGTISTVTNPVSISTGQLTVKRDTLLNGFTFPMYDATTGNPATGLSVAAFRTIDGGSVGASANSPSEVGSGIYKLNMAASDLNGGVITFLFTASSASTTIITLITQN